MPSPHPAPDGLVALDIGGANLKAADGLGWTHTEPFALWREWRNLAEALARILDHAEARHVVATMTGEIADCYASRAAGVAHIIDALVTAARHRTADVGIYLVTGRVVAPGAALCAPLDAAASNWHALARLAAAHAPASRSLLVDVGSTTTDVVALVGGRPRPLSHDDAGRALAGELVYTGIERTPLATIVRTLPHGAMRRPIAAERFADSRDAWLLVGGLPEDPADHDTADGGPATREAARVRLARSILVEPAEFTAAAARAAAERCATVQARRVAAGLARVAAAHGWRPEGIVLSGHGEALARRALALAAPHAATASLSHLLGADVSRAAPAHALALIARGAIA